MTDTNFHAHMHVIYELFQRRMEHLLSQAKMAARMGDEQALAKVIQIMMATLMTLSTDLKQEWENCQTLP